MSQVVDLDQKHPGAASIGTQIAAHVNSVVLDSQRTIRVATAALLAGGHVLLDDVPGVGKTSMAHAFAQCIGGSFQRIQGAVDLMPSDIAGSMIYNPQTGEWSVKEGPVFANVVLVDEVGYLPSRAQSALLEVMEEGQASIDGHPRPLPTPNWVISTRNPTNQGGYPLMPAILDRFAVVLSLGYPDAAAEIELVRSPIRSASDQVSPVCSTHQLERAQRECERVELGELVAQYIVAICRATRTVASVALGASPRAAVTLASMARAWAVMDNRDYVVPDDIQDLAPDVLAHRLVGDVDACQVIHDVLQAVPVPVGRR